MPENPLQALYKAGSKFYDLGTPNAFQTKMQDEKSREQFYIALSKKFDLGTPEEYNNKVSFAFDTGLVDINQEPSTILPQPAPVTNGFQPELQPELQPEFDIPQPEPVVAESTSVIDDMTNEIMAGGDVSSILDSGMPYLIPGTPEYNQSIDNMIKDSPESVSEISKMQKDGRALDTIQSVVDNKRLEIEDKKREITDKRTGEERKPTTFEISGDVPPGTGIPGQGFEQITGRVFPKDDTPESVMVEKAWKSGVAGLKDLYGGGLIWAGYEDSGKRIREEARKTIEDNEIAELYKEFEVTDLGDPDFYRSKGVQMIPSMLSLIPLAIAGGVAGGAGAVALGMGALGVTIVGAVSSALASRPLESAMEAMGTYNSLRDQGLSDEDASVGAARTFRYNFLQTFTDMGQFALAFARVPPGLRGSVSTWLRVAGRTAGFAIGATSEGFEEVMQGYYQQLGESAAKGEVDPSLLEALKMSSPEGKEAFALGTIGGATFQISGGVTSALIDTKLSPKEVNNIIDERISEVEIAVEKDVGKIVSEREKREALAHPQRVGVVPEEFVPKVEPITDVKEITTELHKQNVELTEAKKLIEGRLTELNESLEFELEITNNEDVIAGVQGQIAEAEADLAEVIGEQENVIRQINVNLGQKPGAKIPKKAV